MEALETPVVPGYDIETRIGVGRSGEVFRVRHVDSGDIQALKVAHPSPRHGAEDIAFKQEYHLHSRLQHPDIIRSHRFGEIDEHRRYYTMDYVETVPLERLYRDHGIRALAEVALSVFGALEYAHAQGTLHGDIKPANILVSLGPEGRVGRTLLADFGHARRIGQNAQSDLQGTFAYLAPEEINGWRTDVRSDLYSFGVTLFEAVAGRLPYPASTAKELFQALMELRPPPLTELVPDLDPRWAEFLDALIARNPEKRPRSATAARERLGELLGRSLEPAAALGDAGSFFGATLAHVGRDEELQHAVRLLREPGSVRTLLVTGEEGVGKSRLAEEFARTVELEGGKVYRSDARGKTGSGFRLLRHVRREGRFVDLLEKGRTIGDAADGNTPHPHRKQAELERLVDELLAGEDSMDAECVYLFDSLEAADLDSLAFLRTLQGRLTGSKSLLLLVGQSRPGDALLEEFRSPETREIRLEPLAAEEIRQLLLAHLGEQSDRGGAPAPPLDDVELGRLVDWTAKYTRGNPALIASSLRSLVRLGHLSRRGARWIVDEAAFEERPLPRTAKERAREKLRLLPPEGRAYLELASVCGSEFDADALAASEPFDADAASAFLTDALLHGILTRASGDGHRYGFADPEAGRALYETLDEDTRRAMHRRIADRLETSAGAGVEVAEHLAKADERERARDAFIRAALSNREAGAFQEAGRCFQRAWDLHSPSERAGIPSFAPQWVRTLHTSGHFQEAVDAADQVLGAARKPSIASATVSSLLVWKGICLGLIGRRDEGQRVLRSLLESGQQIEDPRTEALALTQFGIYESHANRRDSAREHLTRARAIAQREELAYEMGKAELNLGILCWREDEPKKALEWHSRAHDHLVKAEGHDLLPAVWGNQAICHWFLLDARRAAASHRKAADGYRRQHRRSEAARSYQNLAHVLTEMGHWVEAERALATADELNRTLRGPRQASYFEFSQARLALHRGKLEDAARHADHAIDLAREVDDAFVTTGHRCLRALVEIESGRFDQAARIAEQTLVMARELDYRFGIAESLFLLGRATRHSGKPNQALQYLDDAYDVAVEANQPVMQFHTQLQRAELLAERGDQVGAERNLAECRALQDQCDSILWKGFVKLSEGRVRAAGANHPAAGRALASAYETFANLGAERYRAETLLHQARSHLGMGSHHAARAAMQHARSLFQTLGLPPPPAPFPEDIQEKDGSLHTVRRILEAAAGVSRDITTLQSVDEVLERILDVAITYLGTERGVVALANEDSGELEVRFARNIDRESIADTLEISRSTLASVRREGEIIHTGDALADPRLSIHESVRRGRIRSLISLPIRWGNQVLGALYMDHRTLTDLFGREERMFLQFIADMAAIGIQNARQFEIKEEAVRNLRGELQGEEFVFANTVVGGGPMQDLIRRGGRAAKAGRVILLTGPSGAGKDHLARILHEASQRTGDFVDCPLPNLPETLIASELFGVAPGTATDVGPREGLAHAAMGGTLFLNEVADLPLSLQPKLLDFMEKRGIRKVGSTRTVHLDALIVCATNADLEQHVADGTFRKDLFYRMSECVLALPPLRERQEDISDLADLFLRDMSRKAGLSRCALHPLARDLLMRCRWDGNIRELKSCIARAVDESVDGMIQVHDLESPSLRKMLREAPQGGSVRDEVHTVEIRRIQEAMARAGGIITRAAPILGLSEASLRRRIAKYHLESLVLRPKRRAG